MKKIISVVLALTMIMMLGLTSFAVTLNKDNPTNKDVVGQEVYVKTLTDDGKGGDVQSYTITIPATTTLPWGVDGTLKYTVTTTLLYNKVLNVKAAGNNVMKSINTTETLGYVLGGDTDVKVPAAVTADYTLSFDVTWDKAIDEYQDTLTFTSDIVDAA